jgi:hypothetical protein
MPKWYIPAVRSEATLSTPIWYTQYRQPVLPMRIIRTLINKNYSILLSRNIEKYYLLRLHAGWIYSEVNESQTECK